jgi:hypothetical protein
VKVGPGDDGWAKGKTVHVKNGGGRKQVGGNDGKNGLALAMLLKTTLNPSVLIFSQRGWL